MTAAGQWGGGVASDWTVYHGDPAGSGDAGPSLDLSPAHAVWTSPVLDGAIFSEPLVLGSTVYVTTENDTVYALRATNGSVAWSTHVATPVPSGALPCGDISPVEGFTGTPVIDPARDELFAVADELVSGTPSFSLIGVDLNNGQVELHQDVTPPGASTPALLQRTGLALDGGNVLFGFGGNYGDCGSYHGWVESVPEAGGATRTFEVDDGDGDSQGAVWMGGAAPEIDASGNVWVAAGNGSVHAPGTYDDSDSVLELSSDLALRHYFAPSDWYADNAGDRDLGSSAPALVGTQVVQIGKSQTAYLLSAANLGGIGGQLASVHPACGNDVDGGAAVSGQTVYMPCMSGVMAMAVGSSSSPSLRVLWNTSSGAVGPPIIAGGLVWSIGGGHLDALLPASGAIAQSFPLGEQDNHFPTPSFGDGLLLAPSADQIHAFAGPTSASTTTTATSTAAPTTTAAATPVPAHHATASPSAASRAHAAVRWPLIVGGLAVLLALLFVAWLAWWRPKRRQADDEAPRRQGEVPG
jgi:outer membrane protein assembly factor BamB